MGLQPTAQRRSVKFSVAPIKTKLERGFHRLHGRGWSRRGSAALRLTPSLSPRTTSAPGNNGFPCAGQQPCQRWGNFSLAAPPGQTLPGQLVGLASRRGLCSTRRAALLLLRRQRGRGRCAMAPSHLCGPFPPPPPRDRPHVSCWEQPWRLRAWQGP